jgi:hypothetical protein
MKTKIVFIALFISLFTGFCFSQPQPDGKGPKPPTIEERLKMINEKICQPLKLDKTQSTKVNDAFKDFFVEMDKLIDLKSNPPRMPEKTKVDALANLRDKKVKKVLSEKLFNRYLELEKTTRPPSDGNHPKK